MNPIRQIVFIAGLLVVTALCMRPPYRMEHTIYLLNRESLVPHRVNLVTKPIGHCWIWSPPQGWNESRGLARITYQPALDLPRLSIYIAISVALTALFALGLPLLAPLMPRSASTSSDENAAKCPHWKAHVFWLCILGIFWLTDRRDHEFTLNAVNVIRQHADDTRAQSEELGSELARLDNENWRDAVPNIRQKAEELIYQVETLNDTICELESRLTPPEGDPGDYEPH